MSWNWTWSEETQVKNFGGSCPQTKLAIGKGKVHKLIEYVDQSIHQLVSTLLFPPLDLLGLLINFQSSEKWGLFSKICIIHGRTKTCDNMSFLLFLTFQVPSLIIWPRKPQVIDLLDQSSIFQSAIDQNREEVINTHWSRSSYRYPPIPWSPCWPNSMADLGPEETAISPPGASSHPWWSSKGNAVSCPCEWRDSRLFFSQWFPLYISADRLVPSPCFTQRSQSELATGTTPLQDHLAQGLPHNILKKIALYFERSATATEQKAGPTTSKLFLQNPVLQL